MRIPLFFGLIMSIFFSCSVSAQNSMMHWNNESHYNPAASGVLFKHSANLNFRSPHKSQFYPENYLNANYNVRIGNNHGLGLNYTFNEFFSQQFNYLGLNYNYQLNFNESRNHVLALGAGLHYRNQFFQGEWIFPTTVNDPVLPVKRNHNFFLNFGIKYQWKELGIGISNSSLFYTELNKSKIRFNENQTLNLMVNYNFKIGESFAIKPTVLLGNTLNSIYYRVNSLFILKEKYWVGLNYRNKNIYGFMIGWDILSKYRIGYAFEQLISTSNQGSGGQYITPGIHEVTMGIRIK